MTFTDPNFINAVKEELQKRNYSLIEEIKPLDSSDAFYKVFSITDNEPRVMKVFEDPITNFRENKHLDIIKQLSKYQDDRIVKAYETGYIENDNEIFFFCILEYIEGKSLAEIRPHIFWEKHQYLRRVSLFNQVFIAISFLRENYEIHNDLQTGNVMLIGEDKIKIIDITTSQDSYNEAKPDYDLYLIKNHLMEFFMKPEEIETIKNKTEDFDDIDFKELHRIIVNEHPKEIVNFDTEKLKCARAIENIINFYFTHFNENIPKTNIEKENRRNIIQDVLDLNTYEKIALELGIGISGNWDPETHSHGINHEIYITINPNLLIQIIQHEYGETMKIIVNIDNELVLNREQVEHYLKSIKDLATREEVVPSTKSFKGGSGALSLDEIERILRNSKPEDWKYTDIYGFYVYKPNVELQIKIREDVKGNDKKFNEEWLENFPDKHAFMRIPRIYYRGSYIIEYYFVSVDGGRMLIPLPKAYNDLRITEFQYKLGKILNCWGNRLMYYDIYIFNSAGFSISAD